MRPPERPVYFDGEKIPDSAIKNIFRWPPDVPRSFNRSTLIVGSRGVGKTTLFRYLKVTHDGLAIHLPLAAELSSFGKDEALGPLSSSYSPNVEALVAKKAASLLAISLAERFHAKAVPIDRQLLEDCLPPKERAMRKRFSRDWFREAKAAVARQPLAEFVNVSDDQPLSRFVADAGEKCLAGKGPLLLLLDRADMVVPAALIPIAHLLDQSVHYVALTAMRPGHAGRAFAAEDLGAIPGDQFSVVHIGHSPYTREWRDFLTGAVEAQIGELTIRNLLADDREDVLTLARDSLRTALELFVACRAARGSVHSAIAQALEDIKENHLVAAQRVLHRYHPNYRQLISEIRKEAIRQHGVIDRPIQIHLERSASSLWETNSRLDNFLDAALRSRAACMPHGQAWVPGISVREVELPPVVVWEPGDPRWIFDKAPIKIPKTESAVFEKGGGSTKPPSIFVAYRADFQQSRKFRTDLEALLASHPGRVQIKVLDGKVRHGEDWAPVIRERIKKSRLLVGDITGLRKEVIFELGFGFGLHKIFVPVLELFEQRHSVPRWLRAKQIGSYATEPELISVASSVVAHVIDRDTARPKGARDPVPGKAIWLGRVGDLQQYREQFTATCRQEGLFPEYVDITDSAEGVLEQATRAHVLIAVLDGTEYDALSHFICGAIVAKPSAAYEGHLPRRVFLLASHHADVNALAADSLLRCSETVSVLDPLEVINRVTEAGRAHRVWIESSRVRQSR